MQYDEDGNERADWYLDMLEREHIARYWAARALDPRPGSGRVQANEDLALRKQHDAEFEMIFGGRNGT